MADRVFPIVRLLFPCQQADHQPDQSQVLILNPLAVSSLPAGMTFPYDVTALWVYAQVTDGVGRFDLSVELRRVYDDDTPAEVVTTSGADTRHFPGGGQLAVEDVVVRLTDVPLDGPGLYEFRMLADGQQLDGPAAVLRVLDQEAGL